MSATLTTTPAADGFRMPGEFEQHSGCWLLWPERPSNWRCGAKPAQAAFAAVATAIATGEPVTVGASRAQFVQARAMLPDAIRVVEMSSDDSWMRDVGPTFVVNDQGAVRGVDWIFNAWGGLSDGLYFPWDQDDLVARKVLEIEGRDRYRAPLVLEGGAIHVDGEGTLLATEECLLNPNRNPHLDAGQLEILLHEYLGISSVIWLGKGVIDDETDGHVDNLCCFARPGEVVLTWTDDKRDPQYRVSLDAYERLMDSRDAQGRRLKVHKLQQPGPLYRTREETRDIDAVRRPRRATRWRALGRLLRQLLHRATPRSSCRCSIRAATARPSARSRASFPERRVIGVQAREILLGGGNIHCITQQVPAAQAPAGRAPARRRGVHEPASARLPAARAAAARRLARRAARYAQAREVLRRRDRHRRPGRGPQRDGEQADRVARSEVRHRARVRRGRCRDQPPADVALLARAARVRPHRVLLLGLVRGVHGLLRSTTRARPSVTRQRQLERIRRAGGNAQRRWRARRQDSPGPGRRHPTQATEEAARRQVDALARHGR